MEKHLEELLGDEIDGKTVAWHIAVCVGALFIYVSAGLNQIPNVPENSNLRKQFVRTYERVTNHHLQDEYLKNFNSINDDTIKNANCSEEEIINQLVTIIADMNKNTIHLGLNYEQVLKNRFRDLDLSAERAKAIKSGDIKNLNQNEYKQLKHIAAMYDIYQFLKAESLVRLGIYQETLPAEEINQYNHYLQFLKNTKINSRKDVMKLMKIVESSIMKFMELDSLVDKVKGDNFLQSNVLFIDESTGENNTDWEIYSNAKKLSPLFGDMDLCKCLIMELKTQKSFEMFLDKLANCGYDVNLLIKKAQKIVYEQMNDTQKNINSQNINPLHQTAAHPASTEKYSLKQKKSKFIIRKPKSKAINDSISEVSK